MNDQMNDPTRRDVAPDDDDLSADEMIESWAKETVALAAGHGHFGVEQVAQLLGDPLLMEAVHVRQGRTTPQLTPTLGAREALVNFTSRTSPAERRATSWLDLQAGRFPTKEG